MKNHALSLVFIILLGLAAGQAGADTALHNITGYTSTDVGMRKFDVLVFDDQGRVLAAGERDLLMQYPDAERIDGVGKFVLPGLTDSHAHVYSQGFLSISLNLAGSTSLEDAVSKIAAFARSGPQRGWLLGRGWNQVLWPVREFPNASDIDAVVNKRPVWLRRIDGHAGWANSYTLELAGIDSKTPQPQGGVIRHDPETDEVTGVLEEIPAFWRVWSLIPKKSVEQNLDAIDHAARTYAAAGVTTAQNGRATQDDIDSLREAARRNRLPIRVVIYPVWDIALEMAESGIRLEEESGGKLKL
ncbi:MAG: amidohydrolase family protein, partial [Proteobacteria bacterium]|nr:amidohydrolase family protein [Pseudomonadota bacterium]